MHIEGGVNRNAWASSPNINSLSQARVQVQVNNGFKLNTNNIIWIMDKFFTIVYLAFFLSFMFSVKREKKNHEQIWSRSSITITTVLFQFTFIIIFTESNPPKPSRNYVLRTASERIGDEMKRRRVLWSCTYNWSKR